MGPLLNLEERTEAIVKAQPDADHEQLLHHRGAWRRAILLDRVDFGKQIKASGFELSPAAVSGLYAVGMFIKSLPGTTAEASENDLERLSQAVGSLREDVISSGDLEGDLRAFLLEQVNNMQRRIDLSRVTGSSPVEDLRTETVGSAATRHSMWGRALNSSLRTKIIVLLAALNVYNGGVATLNQSIDDTEHLISTVTQVAERVAGDPPKQIESSQRTAELPPGASEGDND